MKQAVRTGYQIQRADFLSSLINFRYLFFGIFFSLHSLNASHPFCCPFYARKEVPLCIFFFCDRVINVLTFVPTAAHISILAVIRDAVARIFLLLNTSSEWSSSVTVVASIHHIWGIQKNAHLRALRFLCALFFISWEPRKDLKENRNSK